LFLPLTFYFDKLLTVLYLIAIIVILELIQYLTKRGVFDIVDLVLNVFGLFIGIVIRRIYGR
jgi:glycopeptide antibiotics resistance protein